MACRPSETVSGTPQGLARGPAGTPAADTARSAAAGAPAEDSRRDGAITLALLRGSVQSRCRQAPSAFLGMALNTIASVLLIGRGIHPAGIAIWLTASTVLLSLRYRVALLARRELDGPQETLARHDRRFRQLSITTHIVTGAGIWIVLNRHDAAASYMMTLLICLYGVGGMINLSHDLRSLRLSLPLLMGQVVLFWLLQGGEGIAIAVILAGLTLMMLSAGQGSQQAFDDSIRIRFEKDDLILQRDHEKRTALAALQRAEEASRSRTFFMAAASHDLRQPLYAANLLNHALSMHALPPPAQRLVEQQGKALASASALFDDLLDLTRFEAGTITPAIGTVNLSELVQQIEAEFRPQCETRSLALDVEASPCAVTSDYDLLARMIRNLMSNAVRYTERGRIQLRLTRPGGRACLEVADTGPGIAQADQAEIFKAFQQLPQPRPVHGQGAGLGLAIVRHIARLLGHELEFDSAPGRGTRVRILMPVAERPAGTRAAPATAGPDPAHAG